MSKRLFQIFDEMNVNDERNKTQTLPCAFTMVEAKTDKRGGLVTMGVEAHIVQKIFFGEMQPILVVMDKKEYERIEKAAPDVAPDTQLPDEVVQEIKAKAIDYSCSLVFNSAWMTKEKIEEHRTEASVDYQAGATEYATKLHQAQQEIESLTNQLRKHHDVVIENMKVLRLEHEKVIGYLQKTMNIISWQELPDSSCAEILNEIKQYLDGTK